MSTSQKELELIGDSAAMYHLRAKIAQVAPSQIPVLIEGPTGSGKELVAQALHRQSERKGPLVALNVCAIADTMFEDAMFGHVRGAFSGAIGDHAGHLLEAHRGTVFLDEIGSLAMGAQIKLLRALETREFRPIGGRNDRSSDFRLVTATNVPLAKAVSEGAFRADLAFRLSGMVIVVPPLAAHPEDIPALSSHFVARASAERGVSVELTEAALSKLAAQQWHGNVRQLRQVIECAVAFARSSRIGAEEIARLIDPETRSFDESESFELRRLIETLRACDWDVRRTAHRMGMDRTSLYRRVNRLGIDLQKLRRESRREGEEIHISPGIQNATSLPLGETNSMEHA